MNVLSTIMSTLATHAQFSQLMQRSGFIFLPELLRERSYVEMRPSTLLSVAMMCYAQFFGMSCVRILQMQVLGVQWMLT